MNYFPSIPEDSVFLISPDGEYSYLRLKNAIEDVSRNIKNQFVLLEAENNFQTFSRFLGLLRGQNTVFLIPTFQFQDSRYLKMVEEETKTKFLKWPRSEALPANVNKSSSDHEIFKNKKPLFIVRTSGSSGSPYKFIAHDPELFIQKYYKVGNHFERTLAFSPAESIAGIETLLEVFTHGKILVSSGDRPSPVEIKNLINQHQVDYFQTTPSFLNLMLVSSVVDANGFKSLKKIAYGSEPSQKSVLMELKKRLPEVYFNQTYGMSEIGIQKTTSPESDPSIFSLKKEFNPGRISDGMLEVKSLTPLISYLNAETPLSADGWFKTHDVTEQHGEYLKVIGRDSDLINLAGRKFYPSEVEELILSMPEVNDVTIMPEANEIIGTTLMAVINIDENLEEADFRKSFKIFCEQFLPHYMRPHKVKLMKGMPVTSRMKKMRRL